MDALPTLTLTLPILYFHFLIISLIFIDNKCLSDEIWDLKREIKSSAKGGFELGRSHLNAGTIYATETDG